jgi:hypothetical protein
MNPLNGKGLHLYLFMMDLTESIVDSEILDILPQMIGKVHFGFWRILYGFP